MKTVDVQELVAHRSVSDTRQSVWQIRRTFTYAGHKMRATVHQDPYEFQADYYLELFNPRDLKWNRVHTEGTGNWYSAISALDTNRITSKQWDMIDTLIDKMVNIGVDLLEGVDA